VVEAPCERCYATVILLLGQRLDWSAARELFDGMVAAGVPRGEYAYG
jgi:pentatricopeptide repeat protein